MSRARTVRLIALPLAALLVLAGCVDSGPLRDLQALPEADLPPYPGTTLMGETTSPQQPGIEGTTWANQSRSYCIDATEDEIVAYYDSLLAPLGWDLKFQFGVWEKDRYQLRIIDYTQQISERPLGCNYWFGESLSAKPR